MCGIIHCKKTNNKETAKKLVLKRYEKQSARGKQGYGFIEIKNGFVVGEHRSETESEILEKLEKTTADEIMFHHRYPTSTPNIVEATHPIKVSHKSLQYDYYVIHNGVITNDEEMREKHLKQGFVYTTNIVKKWETMQTIYKEEVWNDSEALAIDFALAIENNTEMKSEGSIALIALQYDKTTGKAVALYFGRNAGNPLKMENDKMFFSLSSETGKDIQTNMLYRLDYKDRKITSEKFSIGKYEIPRNYGMGFVPHYWENDYYDYEDKDKKSYFEADEDDFCMDLYEEAEYLRGEIKRANQMGDYDTMTELEIELQGVEYEISQSKKSCQSFF